MEDFGLEKEAIDSIMAQNGKDIEAHKATAEAAAKDRDAYKGQLDDVSAKLKAFDGVDIEALRGEIDTLKGDLAAKEETFATEIANRDFDALLDTVIAEAQGKNPKAIKALLDLDTLRASKNQKEDAQAAVKAASESDAYLFGTAQEATPAKVKTGGEHKEPDNTETDAFTAAAMKGAGLNSDKE